MRSPVQEDAWWPLGCPGAGLCAEPVLRFGAEWWFS